MAIDAQAALAQALANSRAAQAQPAMPGMHPNTIHAIASNLARTLVNQRMPLGQAQVHNPSPIDGGYNWGTRSFAPPSQYNPGGTVNWLPDSGSPHSLNNNPLNPTYRPLVFPGFSVAY